MEVDYNSSFFFLTECQEIMQFTFMAINILIWFLLFSAIISLPVLSILVFILSAARQQAPGSTFQKSAH